MLIAVALGVGLAASCGLFVTLAKNAPLVPECYDSCGRLHCPDCARAARLKHNEVDQAVTDRSAVLSDLSA